MTFQISADGIVSVSAKNVETGEEQAITVTAKSGLSHEELKKMAEENREHLVDMRANERAAHLRQRIERTLRAMDAVMPRVRPLLSNNEFAADALSKAEEVIERSRATALSKPSADISADLELLERDHKALTRTLNMFHTVIEKMKR